jgi:hypothetical protein
VEHAEHHSRRSIALTPWLSNYTRHAEVSHSSSCYFIWRGSSQATRYGRLRRNGTSCEAADETACERLAQTPRNTEAAPHYSNRQKYAEAACLRALYKPELSTIDVLSIIQRFWGFSYAIVEMKHESSTTNWRCTQKLWTTRERGHICRNTCNRQPAVGKVSTLRPVAACCGSGMTPRPSF